MSADLKSAEATEALAQEQGAETQRLVIATQWQLMWWKFRDHKMAYISLYVLAALYLTTLLCEFLSPHDPNQRSALYRHAPPQSIHMIHEGGLRLPFVYPMVRHVDPETRRVTYQDDLQRPLTLKLFARGEVVTVSENFGVRLTEIVGKA